MPQYLLHCLMTREGQFLELGPYYFPRIPPKGSSVQVSDVYLGRMTVADTISECGRDQRTPCLYIDATGLKEGAFASSKEVEKVLVAEFLRRIELLKSLDSPRYLRRVSS